MKLADISIRRPVFATVMVGVLAVFGLFAYPKVGIDLFPDIEFPFATITAVYPGADPETIESKVVDKIEEAVSTVNGIKTLRSTSMESVGLVMLQFELERKADQAVQDVRDKVSSVLKDLPKDLDPPLVQRFDIGAAPIMAIAISGDLSRRELTHLADKRIKQLLQGVNGVGGVDLVGGQEREFHVWIDPQKLESYGLAVGDVMQTLVAQNVEIPGGRLDLGPREFMVKTRGQVHDAKALGNIIISAGSGAPVRIADVGRVEDGMEEARSLASVNGKSAVALLVRKTSEANTVEVAKRVYATLDKLKPQLPAGVKIAVPNDNSTYIKNSIADVQFDLIFGAALAILIILFFLHDWRATFISALALPTSVIATFAFIQAMGYTFNMMTMLALSLSIGILIDDAIVVIENIHRHLEMGKKPLKAAADATAEIGLAVIATTASILAVFVPVATMKGIIGRFFKQFGLTVAFAVAVSLFVAFTLTPMLSARMLKHKHADQEKNPVARMIERFLNAIDRVYRRILGWAMRHRATVIVMAAVAFISSIFLVRFVPMEFMPAEDRSLFIVKLELPTGTAIAVTEKTTEEVATGIRAVPGVDTTFVTVGGSESSGNAEVNRSQIQVNLVPKHKRSYSQNQMMDFVRKQLAARKDVVAAVEPMGMVGGSSAMRNSTLQFNIRGQSYEELNKAAEALMGEMKKHGYFVDLDTSYRGGKPEVAINIDRDRAADLGVPVASIAMTVRNLIAGDKASEIQTDGDRYDVRVKLDESFRQRAQDLLALKIRSNNPSFGPNGMPLPGPGQLVPLSNVVSIADGSGAAKIERQNRQRQVTVYANLSGKSLGPAVTEVEGYAKKLIPSQLNTDWAGMGDMMRESFGNLVSALLLAVIIVYLVLAAQFESFLHPFTIMLSLPLSMVGALGGLALTQEPLGIMAFIGVILLMGLVTKNAILLVDYTDTLRDQGMSREDALLAAGPVRLRPILMTTAAMIFGMIPVALGLSEGGEMRAPMAIVVIGGLITSTMLTLIVVPVAYSLVDSFGERITGKKRHVVTEAEERGEPEPAARAVAK